jgi:hypothetical protein
MGIVTSEAFSGNYRGMPVFVGDDIFMALDTQSGNLLFQQAALHSLMGIMTGYTLTPRHRPMDVFLDCHPFMALKTELTHFVHQYDSTFVRRMFPGIEHFVAGCTFTGSHGRVNGFPLRLCIVTRSTVGRFGKGPHGKRQDQNDRRNSRDNYDVSSHFAHLRSHGSIRRVSYPNQGCPAAVIYHNYAGLTGTG